MDYPINKHIIKNRNDETFLKGVDMRKLAVWGVCSLLLLAGAQVRADPGWITDTHGCKVWDSTPAPNETVTWTGACVDGLANGNGILVWYENGQPTETYNGQLTMGHYHGYGTQVWQNGDSYTGDYKNDQADGQGTYRTHSGEAFSGEWINGCLQGGSRRMAVGVPLSQCP
jgi:hypothetical protein